MSLKNRKLNHFARRVKRIQHDIKQTLAKFDKIRDHQLDFPINNEKVLSSQNVDENQPDLLIEFKVNYPYR